jgi:flagella basal body P-ring formation protein FlgA
MAQPLLPEEVRAALLSALHMPDATVELVEFSNKPLPPGQLVFSLAALSRPPENDPQTPVIWPGKLMYDGQHSVSVWAKVRISVFRRIFVATETIPKAAVIRAEQIVSTRVAQFPGLEPAPSSVAVIVGKVARRAIPAGQSIVAGALDDAKDVVRGETVHVKVLGGAAIITFDAVAEASGQKGESILLHNPLSGRSFHARIADRGRVIVVSTEESTL